MKLFSALLALLLCVNSAHAADSIPKNIEEFSLGNLKVIADNTLKVTVQVDDENLPQPHIWDMIPSDIAILYTQLANVNQVKERFSDLMIENPSESYNGLLITITNKYGEELKPFRIFNGDITSGDKHIATDTNRDIEYTIWGLNDSPRNLELTWRMMPIISFNDCMKLGNQVVETTPRQCLLSNGDIFLDVNEEPTQEALSVKTFDDCLVKGQALINTFPRRCITAGGHVFAEPARVK